MYKLISTYTGRHFDPYHAVAADLDVRDIAHAQSLMPRPCNAPRIGRSCPLIGWSRIFSICTPTCAAEKARFR